MLPKDYLAYKLSGVHCTDVSDASGMLLLDVKNRCWSEEMCEICGIRKEQLAQIFESYEVVGTLLPEIAQELGLPGNVKVIAGAGDNAAAAVGTGTVGDGMCNISLGTSGTIFYFLQKLLRGQQQCAARVCPCGREIPSDGMHAQRGFLQQVVDG